MSRKNYRLICGVCCLAVLGIAAACGKSEKRAVPTLTLFNVKPFEELPPMPSSAATVNVGSLSFRAAPLWTDEESQELFEANLQLAGLLPVRIEITHNGGEPIDPRKIRLRLHGTNGEEWQTLSIKKAIGRILTANEVYAYNPNARKTFEKEFGSYELNLKTPLTKTEGRRGGFVFFQSPRKAAVASPRGLVLDVQGLSQPISIPLN